MFESLFQLFTKIIETVGYFGVFVLMTLESMVAPVPSEGVMPFAGFLVTQGKFNMTLVIVVSSIGSIVGSLISYYVGAYGGKPVVLKYGKYLLLDKHHLEITERFFEKYGEKTIFFCRFIPVVRHFISIPAGAGNMKLPKFCIYTIVGATIWNAFLAYTGVWLGARWELVHKFTKYLDILVVLLAAGFIGYLVYKHTKNIKKIPE